MDRVGVAISTVIGKRESDKKHDFSNYRHDGSRVRAPVQVQDDGYAVVGAGLDSGALSELGTLLDTKHPGERNLLDIPIIRRLARLEARYNLAHPRCSVTIALLFEEFFSLRRKSRTGK